MYEAEPTDDGFGGYDGEADMARSDIDPQFGQGLLSHAAHPWLAGMHLDAPVVGIRPARCVSPDGASLTPQMLCTPNTIEGGHAFVQAVVVHSPATFSSICLDWEHAAALPSLVAPPSPSTFVQQTTPPHHHSSCPGDNSLFLALPSFPQVESAFRYPPVAGSLDEVPNPVSEPHPSTPSPGPSEPAPTAPSTIKQSESFPSINKRSRGRQVPVSPDGKPVKVQCKNGVIKARHFICPYPGCAKTFSRNEHVKRHIRCLHTNGEGWVCQYGGDTCRKTFPRKDNYQQHVRKAHPDQTWVDSP
ncbi:hypothetical protein PISMIDRAFT_671661 [Pisolithus microcarpus 441]|uniref:C2H2-type domain-containing protein n=1 Tax=Pisolithus microcarpus 441 TaxID=765257 RepID=A0A0D0ACC7_9AGAM|nr:hypothetical protein PISMIDRAFT_671661 [Pisolithus microcarpus 441]